MSITPEQLAGNSEDGEQKALFCWISLNVATYPELTRCFHIPNGGFRNIREAAKLKAMGVRAGVPDLFLPVKRGLWSGLFIELKFGKGKASDKQTDWGRFLQTQGFGFAVCIGWIEARDMLIKYLEWK